MTQAQRLFLAGLIVAAPRIQIDVALWLSVACVLGGFISAIVELKEATNV
jgi:hypothetical protein